MALNYIPAVVMMTVVVVVVVVAATEEDVERIKALVASEEYGS